MIDCQLVPWISFSSTSQGKYYFHVKIARYITLEGYPLIQIGVDYLSLPIDLLHSLDGVLKGVPLLISQNDEIPRSDGSGTYTVPEDLKLDFLTAPTIVNPAGYVAASVIDWAIPSYFFAVATYIPTANSLTVVPDSLAGYRPPQSDQLTPEGCYFMPRKNTFSQGIYEIAFQQSTFNYTVADVWGMWAYDGYIPSEEEHHIWEEYNDEFFYVHPPFIQYSPGIKGISTDNTNFGGYPLFYHSYTGKYALQTLIHTSPNDLVYYPGRLPNTWPPVEVPFFGGIGLAHILHPALKILEILIKERKRGVET